MKLDDFRQQWQQAEPTGPGRAEDMLPALLTAEPSSPVSRMLRNARQEVLTTAFFLALGAVGLLLAGASWLQPFGVLLMATAGLTAYDYYHKRRVLRGLQASTGEALNQHLQLQVQRLRRLLRVYYLVTMATLVGVSGLLLYWAYAQVPELFGGQPGELWRRGLWLASTLVVSWLITGWITRWHLQQQYGRHLDQLEASLRELEEQQ